jgi:hypothetical protein
MDPRVRPSIHLPDDAAGLSDIWRCCLAVVRATTINPAGPPDYEALMAQAVNLAQHPGSPVRQEGASPRLMSPWEWQVSTTPTSYP